MTPTGMTLSRILILAAAVAVTAVAAIAALAQWCDGKAGPYLYVSAVGGWIVFATLNSTDRIRADIHHLVTAVTNYGDERHSGGVLDGMRKAGEVSPPTTLRGLR